MMTWVHGNIVIRSDHLFNTKRGGVCIYYRRSLPLRVINIGYLHKYLSFEQQIGDKISNFVPLYRSLSQSLDDFETFADTIIKTRQVPMVAQLKMQLHSLD